MSGFSKLHSSLTASSLWNEPDKTRIVFITMLSMANSNGDVKASIVGLAHQARETLPDTEKALETLLAPDPHSGRKEMEGRRIVPIDGGWHLVTHEFYRELGMSEDTKRYWRDKQRERRESLKLSRTVKDKRDSQGRSGKHASGIVSDSVQKGECEGKGLCYPNGALVVFQEAFKKWIDFRKGLGKRPKDWQAMFQEQLNWIARQPKTDWLEIISQSMRNGWQGLFELKKQSGVRPNYNGQRSEIKPDKIDVPERFKSWVAEHYPDRRADAMKWQIWSDVPKNGLREEWWSEEKKKLGIPG